MLRQTSRRRGRLRRRFTIDDWMGRRGRAFSSIRRRGITTYFHS